MAEITDYDSLLVGVRAAMGRTPVAGAMSVLTSDINRNLRIRQMLTEVTQSSLTLPDDFLQAETVKVGGIVYTPSHEGAQSRGDGGSFAVQGSALLLNPSETTPSVLLRYYAKQDEIASNTTNAILTKYPDIYMFGWMYHHARLVRDETGAAAWGPAYMQAMDGAMTADAAAAQSSISMRVMPRASA